MSRVIAWRCLGEDFKYYLGIPKDAHVISHFPLFTMCIIGVSPSNDVVATCSEGTWDR